MRAFDVLPLLSALVVGPELERAHGVRKRELSQRYDSCSLRLHTPRDVVVRPRREDQNLTMTEKPWHEALTLKELRALPMDELIQRHDYAAGNVVASLDYFRNEITRRDLERSARRMEHLTWAIAVFTIIVAIATVVSTYYVMTA